MPYCKYSIHLYKIVVVFAILNLVISSCNGTQLAAQQKTTLTNYSAATS